jgi:hypothetical protein
MTSETVHDPCERSVAEADALYTEFWSASVSHTHGGRCFQAEFGGADRSLRSEYQIRAAARTPSRNDPESEGSEIVREPYGRGAADGSRAKRNRGDVERTLSRHSWISKSNVRATAVIRGTSRLRRRDRYKRKGRHQRETSAVSRLRRFAPFLRGLQLAL